MNPFARNRGVIWVTLVAVCVLLGATPVFAVDVYDVVGQVSQSQYQTYQVTVQDMGLGLYGGTAYNQGYRNRDGWKGDGTKGNQEARLYLTDQFTGMGLNVSVQGDYKNVVAELRGTETPNKVYIVGGHYDHVGGTSPGGDDNASGTAGVLEAARILSQYQFKSTIRFIGFNAEEDGLLGSSNYVSTLAPGEQIAGMINLDMILRPGWDSDPTHVKDLNIASHNSSAWVSTFVSAAGAYVPSLQISSGIEDLQGGSDQWPFENAGIPALLAIDNAADELWHHGANAYYHTSNDASDLLANEPNNPSHVTYDYAFATDVVRATVGTLAAGAVLTPEPATMALLAAGGIASLLRRRRK